VVRTPSRSLIRVFLLALLLILGGAVASQAEKPENRASDELKWGSKAARRGYWQEAHMRFDRADGLTPNQPRILNNLAISLEALGRYEEARETYERALALAPNDGALRRNHSRFVEFYTEHVVEAEAEEQAPPSEEPAAEVAPPTESGEGGVDAQG
jgi:Flp pilus assembly protein TadD